MEIDTRTLTEAEKTSLSEKYLKILEFCADESAEYSIRHYKKICKIIDAKPTPSAGVQRIKKRRLAALLVAAVMLLLAGCTAVFYKEQIGDFFTEVYEKYIKGSFAEEDAVNNQFINEYYTLTYVPEGYESLEKNTGKMLARYVWENADGAQMIFAQAPINSGSFFLDNESGTTDVIEMGEYTIYCRIIDGTYSYIWNNEEYAFALYFDNEISEEEIIEIISKIKLFEK